MRVICSQMILAFLLVPSAWSQTKLPEESSVRVKAAGITFYGTRHLLSATQQTMKRGLQREKLDKGKYIIALFGLDCGECERAAKSLTTYTGRDVKIIGLVYAYPQQTVKWCSQLGLKYEVRSVGHEVFDDLGAVFLPTIILVEDGRALGCRVPAMERK